MVHPPQISAPVMLYDDTCGFCADSVRFVLRHDRRGTLRFAPLDGVYARGIIERYPELRDVDSVLYVDAGRDGAERVVAYSAAAMSVAAYLGGRWRLLLLGRIVPAAVRDAVYRLVARHRHRLSGNRPQCFVQPPQERARFLE